MVQVARCVWGGSSWAWRAWLSSLCMEPTACAGSNRHFLPIWAMVQTNCRQWCGYQPCGLASACALLMASVSTLVSNTALGPGLQGPVMGSVLLLHPAPHPPTLLTSFYLFLFGYAGFSLLHQLFSSCDKEGLLFSCSAQASHCGGFSHCGAPRCTSFRNCDI